MKSKLFLLVILSVVLCYNCSKDDTKEDVIDKPIVVIEDDDEQDDEEVYDFDVDDNGFALDAGFPFSETTQYMVDPNATAETVALFYNLKRVSRTKTIVGQQDAYTFFYKETSGDSDIKKTTGSEPGLLGLDFMFITDDQNTDGNNQWFKDQETGIIEDAIEAYNRGMVVTFAWHFREPYEGIDFYTDKLDNSISEKAFESLLPGGENHEYYKAKLDKISEVLLSLKGANGELVPVIFRPFHEFDGSWFWWGEQWVSTEDFIQGLRFTVDYLRDEKGVHNVLYAFSPDNHYSTSTEYLERYPGDNYVDIIAMDNYGDFGNGQGASGASKANEKLQYLTDLAKERHKIAALSETGYYTSDSTPYITGWFSNYFYNAITDNKVEIAYTMTWSNNNDGYYIPTPVTGNQEDFKNFVENDDILLQDGLPNMYEVN